MFLRTTLYWPVAGVAACARRTDKGGIVHEHGLDGGHASTAGLDRAIRRLRQGRDDGGGVADRYDQRGQREDRNADNGRYRSGDLRRSIDRGSSGARGAIGRSGRRYADEHK